MLRAEVGEVDDDLAAFWTEVQSKPAEQRDAAFDVRAGDASGKKKGRRRRRSRGRRKKTPAAT